MILIKERVGKLIADIKELIYTDSIPIDQYRFFKFDNKLENPLDIQTDKWEILDNKKIWEERLC